MNGTGLIAFCGVFLVYGIGTLVSFIARNVQSHSQEWRDSRLVAWLKKDLPQPPPPVDWDYYAMRLVRDNCSPSDAERWAVRVAASGSAVIPHPSERQRIWNVETQEWATSGGTEKVRI